MSKKINNILKYSSYLLVFLLPLVFCRNLFYPYTSPKMFFFYGLTEILFAIWLFLIITDRSYRLSKKTWLYFIPLGAYLFWMTVAGIFGTNPELSFWSSIGRETGLLTLYHCLVFAFVVASLVKKNGTVYLYKLMQWFVSGGFVLAISVWCGNEGFNIFSFLKDSAGGGLMGNSSLTAAYLLFALVFGAFLLFLKDMSKNKKWWIGTEMTVILFSPLFINIYGLFTGSGILGSARGATLGIAVIVITTFLAYLFFSKNKTIKLIGITGIVLGIFIFSFGWMQLMNPNTKLHQEFVKVAYGTRFIFWDTSQKAINEHPWLGFGPENYMVAFQKNFNPKLALPEYNHEGWDDRAHNIYYDTGVSGGYPAIILYFLFILSILYGLYNLKKNEKFKHGQIAILIGLIVGYVFQNLFVFDSLYTLMALFALAGIVFSLNGGSIEEKYLPISIKVYLKNILICFLLVVCSVSLIYFVFRPMKKVATYYMVMSMPLDSRYGHFNDLLVGSSIGDQYDTSQIAYDIYSAYNADPVGIKNNRTNLPFVVRDIDAALQYLEKINKKNKTDARLKVQIISLYNILNYFMDEPYNSVLGKHLLDIQEQLKQLSPTDPQVFLSKAQIYAWAQDLKNVEQSYREAIALDPTIPESYNFLLRVSKAVGDEKTYSETLTEAQKNNVLIDSSFK